MFAGPQMHVQPIGNHGHRRPGAGEIHLLDARFAMDSQPQFGLAVGDTVLARRSRHHAGGQGHTDRGDFCPDTLGRGGNGAKVGPGFGQRARHFVNEQCPGNAARLRQVGQRDIIIDDNHLYRMPQGAGPLRSQAEIQPVPGIILHNQKAPRRSGDRKCPRQHCLHRRRGEHIAAHRCREHATANKPGMGRFMARPATRDQRHL